MNEAREDLALQREVLLARASLSRLKIRYHASALRESVTWRGAGAAAAGSPPAREFLFLLAAESLGRGRAARWLRLAARTVAIARLAQLALTMLRRKAPSGPPQA